MASFYNNPLILLPPTNTLYQTFLTLDNTNRPVTGFHFWPGLSWEPGCAWQGDERTGRFWAGEGKEGWSALGHQAFQFEQFQLKWFDRSGNFLSLRLDDNIGGNFELQLPARNGTLATLDDLPQGRTQEDHYVTLVDNEYEFFFDGYEMFPNTVEVYLNGIRQTKGRQVVVTETSIEVQHNIPAGTEIQWSGILI